MADEFILIEMAKLVREAEDKVRAKMAAQQTGELFDDIPVSDHATPATMRLLDKR